MSEEKGTGPVGVVGLGLVGAALAERLLDAGYEVVGFDIDREKTSCIPRRGMRVAGSLRELGATCRTVVIAVFTTAHVIDVLEGPGGLAEAAEGGEVTAICVSTCEPDAISTLARRAANLGIAVIELPLSGHSGQVRAGEATGLVAGDSAAIARVETILDVLCPRRFDIGKPGDAARAKLAINLVLQLNRCALAEGLVFAARVGLDARAFLKVLAASPAHSDVMETKAEKMIERDFAPQSHIAETLKDAQLILQEAQRVGQPLPLMEINTALLAATIELGGPERDSSAVIEAIRARR